MPSIGKQVLSGVATAALIATTTIVAMAALKYIGATSFMAMIVTGIINGVLVSTLYPWMEKTWWGMEVPSGDRQPRTGYQDLRLIPADELTVADLYNRYYSGPNAPDWNDQFHMLRHVKKEGIRITLLRKDREEGEYWAFDIYRPIPNDDLPFDACRRICNQDFRQVHGHEHLYRGALLVVRS